MIEQKTHTIAESGEKFVQLSPGALRSLTDDQRVHGAICAPLSFRTLELTIN